jgi:hypothetical protein
MGVFCKGGIGKSRLIELSTFGLQCIGHDDELPVTATTGAAAHNINGTTIYSSLAIRPQEKANDNCT